MDTVGTGMGMDTIGMGTGMGTDTFGTGTGTGMGTGTALVEWECTQYWWNRNKHGNGAVGNGYNGAVETEYWHSGSSKAILVHIQGPGKLFLIFYHTQT